MYIEKYTAHVRDTTTKKTFKLVVDENTAQEAHKKIMNKLSYYQEIFKINDNDNNTVFELEAGFAHDN
jgi:hypothetical protein